MQTDGINRQLDHGRAWGRSPRFKAAAIVSSLFLLISGGVSVAGVDGANAHATMGQARQTIWSSIDPATAVVASLAGILFVCILLRSASNLRHSLDGLENELKRHSIDGRNVAANDKTEFGRVVRHKH